MKKQITWTSATGLKTKISDLDHQYLSNIIWFNEVFHGVNRNDRVQFELSVELHRRFNGNRLPWKPLPVLEEVEYLRKMGFITDDGDIIGNKNTGFFEGEIIGNINHIKFYGKNLVD